VISLLELVAELLRNHHVIRHAVCAEHKQLLRREGTGAATAELGRVLAQLPRRHRCLVHAAGSGGQLLHQEQTAGAVRHVLLLLLVVVGRDPVAL